MENYLLKLQNICFSYDQKPILNDLSFTIEEGKFITIFGSSGSGKSTLAYLIAGILEPNFGNLLWKEGFFDYSQKLDRFKKIQLVFQDPSSALTPFYTPFKTIQEVLFLHTELPPDKIENLTKKALEDVGLVEEVFHREIYHLSGGQKQRLVIARALCVNPSLLILDEPTSSCDLLLQAQILAMIKQKQLHQNLTVLMISHDIKQSLKVADKILVLDQGNLDYYGCPLNQERISERSKTKELLAF